MRTILVTGAAGFIGSNFVRLLRSRKDAADVKLVAFDKLTYAGNLANLQDLIDSSGGRVVFVKGDIADEDMVSAVWKEHGVTEVVNFAAESHVDRSILGSGPFVQTNVVGTQVLLDTAKAKGVTKFLQVSTDEVYGTLPEDRPEVKFTEETPLQPNSPYSASKAAVIGLTKVLALEWAPHGVTVNAVAPSLIETDMMTEVTGGDAGRHDRAGDP